MTKEQAIEFYDSGAWKGMTHEARAKFQMVNDLLCMPFDVFHLSLEKTLGRPVWTHELGTSSGRQRIMDELFGGAEPPTMKEIVEMVPAAKRILVVAP